jgi:hypothetical protein
MKKILVILAVLILSVGFFACDNGGGNSSSHNNDAGDFAGTWTSTVMGQTATVTISNTGWTISIPALSHSDNGDFNRNGNTATLYAESIDGGVIGTATIIDQDDISVTLNSKSSAPGTYSLSK